MSIQHGGVEAHLIALDVRTGKQEYSSALGFPVVQDIAASGNDVFVAGLGKPRSTGMTGDVCDQSNPVVRGVTTRDGMVAWSIDSARLALSAVGGFVPPLSDAANGDVVVQRAETSSTFEVRRGSDGALRTKIPGYELVGVDDGVALANDVDRSGPQLQRQPSALTAIDSRTGKQRWRIAGMYAEALAVDGDTLIVLAHPDAQARAAIAYTRGSPADLAHQREEAQLRRTSFVAAIDLRSGRVLWRARDSASFPGGTHGFAVVAGGVAVELGGVEGTGDSEGGAALIAYDSLTGHVLWRHSLSRGQWSLPVSDGRAVYVGQVAGAPTAGDVVAFDLRSGAPRWGARAVRMPVTKQGRDVVALAWPLGVRDGVLVLAGDSAVVGMRTSDGRIVWRWDSTKNLVPTLSSDALVVGQYGRFCSFDD